MPYDIKNTKYLIIEKGYLQWPRINQYAYTDLNNPSNVYIKDKINNQFIAHFIFLEDRIELYEII